MTIDVRQLRFRLVRPILDKYKLGGLDAENLILGTCAQESNLGSYIVQRDSGPALSIYQIEPATYTDVVANVVPNPKLQFDFDFPEDPSALIWDLRLATIICRLCYWRHSEPLPMYNDVGAMAAYWKKYYNTPGGKGTTTDFIRNYNKYVRGSEYATN